MCAEYGSYTDTLCFSKGLVSRRLADTLSHADSRVDISYHTIIIAVIANMKSHWIFVLFVISLTQMGMFIMEKLELLPKSNLSIG